MSNTASPEVKSTICVAYFNKVTGNVWVENSSGTESIQLAQNINGTQKAYAVLGVAGMIRRGSWGIVPGMPQVRQVTAVFPQED
jgi:hypothetical protein